MERREHMPQKSKIPHYGEAPQISFGDYVRDGFKAQLPHRQAVLADQRTQRSRHSGATTIDDVEPVRDAESDDANDAVSEAENRTKKEDTDCFSELIEKCRNDAGAAFESSALNELADMKAKDPPQWQRLRKRLKDAGVRLTDLERAMRTASSEDTDHGDFASDADLYRDRNGDATPESTGQSAPSPVFDTK
jgi:hypothetical protein